MPCHIASAHKSGPRLFASLFQPNPALLLKVARLDDTCVCWLSTIHGARRFSRPDLKGFRLGCLGKDVDGRWVSAKCCSTKSGLNPQKTERREWLPSRSSSRHFPMPE